ncbi:MAG TPA: glycosyltransferase family 10, partial [Rectinemataceae bacterium]|nr:glycosyltransferase family 10 [Rectinemataceae bacterium]
SNKERFRTWAFRYLDKRIGVGSGGRAFNNVGGPVPDKVAFLKGYRFSIAFENTRWPGYTTEKLLESYAAGTVPIYWGDPVLRDWFDRGAFLTLGGKADIERLSRELLRIGDDFDVYRSMYERPLFRDNVEPEPLRAERIVDFLENVAAAGLRRSRRGRISDYQAFAWSYRWRFKQWNHVLRPFIAVLRGFAIFPFVFDRIKSFLRPLVRGDR